MGAAQAYNYQKPQRIDHPEQFLELLIRGDCTRWTKSKVSPIFVDIHGIISNYSYLEMGKTINREFYIALLKHLKDEIAENLPTWRILMYFNILCRMYDKTMCIGPVSTVFSGSVSQRIFPALGSSVLMIGVSPSMAAILNNKIKVCQKNESIGNWSSIGLKPNTHPFTYIKNHNNTHLLPNLEALKHIGQSKVV